jgi:simple sugar transport system permease protein
MIPWSLKLEKRLVSSRRATWLVPLASILLALIFGALLLLSVGANPLQTYRAMLEGAFGTPTQWQRGQFYSLTETVVKAIPIMLTGLSVAVAFRMRFWNIGAEGQLVMGGVAAAAIGLWFPGFFPFLPESRWVWLPLVMGGSIIAGAIWALIPAFLKAYLKVDEIITTLMFNYIAILFYQYLFNIAWKDPAGFGFPGTAMLPEYTWLPRIAGRMHWGVVLAIVSAVLVWVLLERTRQGYEIRLIGENAAAGKYAGISLARTILLVMFVSGGLAGLAGMSEVTGISWRLQRGLAVGSGFTGIIVAWLARLNPWGVLLVGFLLAALFVGGEQIQMTMGLPASVAQVLQGAILLFVLGGNIFVNYRVRLMRRGGKRAAISTGKAEEK